MSPTETPSPFTPLPAHLAPFPSFTKTWHRNTYPSISPLAPSQTAAGKTILITGGGSGIGASTARSFASAGAAHIAILGRTESKLLATKATIESTPYITTTVWPFVCDVTSESAVDATFSTWATQIKSTTGAALEIDILVLNAGYCTHDQPLTPTLSIPEWSKGITGNLTAPLIVTRAFLSYTRPPQPGQNPSNEPVIINIASCASFILMMPGISAYSVSKAAGAVLMQCLQLEYPGPRVVSVQPGGPDSEMQRSVGVEPMDDVSLAGDFNVWLAGKEAGFLKGKYVFANWDVDEMVARKEEIVRESLLECWPTGLPRTQTKLTMKSGEKFTVD